MDEPAEDAEAYTDASDVGDDEHDCVKVAFEVVHGLWFSRWNKSVRWRAAPLGGLEVGDKHSLLWIGGVVYP